MQLCVLCVSVVVFANKFIHHRGHRVAQRRTVIRTFRAKLLELKAESPIVPNVMTSKAVQLVQLLRSSKREKRLGTVILFVTSRCNAFCQTCFYHEELNQPGDLTFAQLEKISQTMPSI